MGVRGSRRLAGLGLSGLPLLAALLPAFLAAAAAHSGAGRTLRQQGPGEEEVLVPLRTHVDGYALIGDEGLSCYNQGDYVKRGRPLGCGLGCQYVSESFTGLPETSATFARGPEFFGQAHPIVGPPDAWPSNMYSDYAWTSRVPDRGAEHITVRIGTPVIVTGMEIFEVNNPGAITEIRGRLAPENGELDASGRRIRHARIWRPPILAGRTDLMDEFYLALNTSAVAGFNQIDAVKVFGDLETGMPVNDYQPMCASADDEDCWAACREADVLTHERLEATLELLRGATAWLSRLLRVVAGPPSLVLPLPPSVDPEWVGCGDLELPREPFQVGLPGAELAIFPTARPSASPLSVSSCLRGEGGAGRPLALRLNVVPQYAAAATAVGSAGAARDAVLQQLFLALGWSTEYAPRLVERWGPNAHAERNVCDADDPAADCDGGWAIRSRLTRSTPALVAAAAAHFGVGPASLPEGVELEQSGPLAGAGLKLRLFNGELMATAAYASRAVHDAAAGWTFPAGLRPAAKSAISLGLLEDLGWYYPVYANAEALPWGAGRGLDFVLSPCNSWPDDGGTYVCPRAGGPGSNFDADSAGARTCNAGRTHVGLCSFVNHPQRLPDAYDYFNDPVNAVNWGGASRLADYCPLVLPEPSGMLPLPNGAAAVRDCTALRTTAVLGTDDYQNPGPGGACFAGRRANQQTIVGCYKHWCDSAGVLSLAVGHQVLACPPEGGELYFELFGMTLRCPPASEMCPQYPTAVPPSVRAMATTCPLTSGDCRLPGELTSGRLNVGLELTNFELGVDGTLTALLGGRQLMEWTEDPAPGQLRKTVVLSGIPQATKQRLVFQLRDRRGLLVYADEHTITVTLGPNSVYASDVLLASSEYVPPPGAPDAEVALHASAVLGPHDQARAQHSLLGRAWSPARGGAGEEFLTLRFPETMYPTAVVLYESLSPGSLVRVEAQSPNRTLVVLYAAERDPLATRPADFPAPGNPLPPTGTTQVDLRGPAPFPTDTLRLTFATPSWPELDAVKMVGYSQLLPTASYVDGIDSLVAAVPARGSARVSLPLRIGGDSMLLWALQTEDGAPLPAWLRPDATTGAFDPASSSSGVLKLQFTVLAPVGAPAAESVRLSFRNAMLGELGELANFKVLRVVDYAIHPEPPPPACYHGSVVRDDPRRSTPDRCECAPGAYGQACEFLTCPANCSSPVGADAALSAIAAAAQGLCDARRGQCTCMPGYSGLDCSGSDGDCYVSYDGRCRAGWRPGRFILNTEDENNINRGVGLLPKGFLCDDGQETCYQNMVALQFCCRPAVDAECPFEAVTGSPCQHAACSATALNWAEPACLAAVHEYCFFAPGDAACHAFRPIPPPPDFCPVEVALEWCAGEGAHRPECVDVLGGTDQSPSGCAFLPLPGNPCEQAACAADALSPACAPFITAWCDGAPEDPECEAHLAGDACLFVPGSPPCVEAACLAESYSARECVEVVAFHCGSTAGEDDPECGLEGFGTPPPHARPAAGPCQWDAIRAHCHSPTMRGSPGCQLLHAYGVVDSPTGPASAADMQRSASALKAAAEAAAVSARMTFNEFAIGRERARRSTVARHSAYMKLFLALDANKDARMVAAETKALPRAIRAAKAELEISPLGAAWVADIPKDHLLDALAAGSQNGGNFVTFAEFAAVLEGLYSREAAP
eukprot:jgi/Tetstr1/436270/TSEL_025112.t1